MENFCMEHKFEPIELNQTFPESNSVDPNEYKIHVMINEELDKWINNNGGNSAAASDMARLKKDFLEKYGTYIDFDVFMDTSKLNEIHQVKTPITLNAEDSSPNNDMVAAAINEDGSLHEEAIKELNAMQQLIIDLHKGIKNYDITIPFSKETILYSPLGIGIANRMYDYLFKEYRKSDPENSSIHGFRVFIEQLDNKDLLKAACALLKVEFNEKLETENDPAKFRKELDRVMENFYGYYGPESLKRKFYIKTVADVTGPCALARLYNDNEYESAPFKTFLDDEFSKCIKFPVNGDLSWLQEIVPQAIKAVKAAVSSGLSLEGASVNTKDTWSNKISNSKNISAEKGR